MQTLLYDNNINERKGLCLYIGTSNIVTVEICALIRYNHVMVMVGPSDMVIQGMDQLNNIINVLFLLLSFQKLKFLN